MSFSPCIFGCIGFLLYLFFCYGFVLFSKNNNIFIFLYKFSNNMNNRIYVIIVKWNISTNLVDWIRRCSLLAALLMSMLSYNDVCTDVDVVHHNRRYLVTLNYVSMYYLWIGHSKRLHHDIIYPIIDSPVCQNHTTFFRLD